MTDLIILGTGVHSMEMAEIIGRINSVKPQWRLLGYISPKEELVGTERNGYTVLGTIGKLAEYPDAKLVPDNEFPRPFTIPRERFISIIDPSTFVSSTARIGVGCVIYPHCFIGREADLGDFVFSLSGTIINHNDRVGEYSVFASNAVVAGDITIGPGVYTGQSSTIRQLLTIGEKSLIGMGSVNVKSVQARDVMVGNPAGILRKKE
jgi:acetyltransferase-like isoleucine patch superfamily enzyme